MQLFSSVVRWTLVAAMITITGTTIRAQGKERELKPYKLQTSGRQLSIRSTKSIQHLMVWTTDGNRIIEQKNINSNYFTIDIPVHRKTFYLMIGLANGKIYTEKIGIL
jgi:NADH dehydrogenase FAD-containing subunit